MTDILFDKDLISKMDNKTKLFVYGFMRHHSDLLLLANNNNSFYNIPELVTFICLSYFYSVEYFTINQAGSIICKNLKTTKCNRKSGWISIFGRHSIESISKCHCVWDLKLYIKDCWYIIGITSNKEKMDTPFQRNKIDYNYAYYMQCNEAFCKYKRKQYGEFEQFKNCKELTVSMDLNLKTQTLSFYLIKNKNKPLFRVKKYQGIMYGNIKQSNDIKYSLAVSLYGKNAKCTVCDFRVY